MDARITWALHKGTSGWACAGAQQPGGHQDTLMQVHKNPGTSGQACASAQETGEHQDRLVQVHNNMEDIGTGLCKCTRT